MAPPYCAPLTQFVERITRITQPEMRSSAASIAFRSNLPQSGKWLRKAPAVDPGAERREIDPISSAACCSVPDAPSRFPLTGSAADRENASDN